MGAGELGESQRCGRVPRHLESLPCTWPSESPALPPCPWWTSSSRMGESLPAHLRTSSSSSTPVLFVSLLHNPSPLPLFLPDFDPPPLSVPLPASLSSPHRGHLDAKAADGNSALHWAALYNQSDCLKLLLKGRASLGTGGAPSTSPSRLPFFPAPGVELPALFPYQGRE